MDGRFSGLGRPAGGGFDPGAYGAFERAPVLEHHDGGVDAESAQHIGRRALYGGAELPQDGGLHLELEAGSPGADLDENVARFQRAGDGFFAYQHALSFH